MRVHSGVSLRGYWGNAWEVHRRVAFRVYSGVSLRVYSGVSMRVYSGVSLRVYSGVSLRGYWGTEEAQRGVMKAATARGWGQQAAAIIKETEGALGAQDAMRNRKRGK